MDRKRAQKTKQKGRSYIYTWKTHRVLYRSSQRLYRGRVSEAESISRTGGAGKSMCTTNKQAIDKNQMELNIIREEVRAMPKGTSGHGSREQISRSTKSTLVTLFFLLVCLFYSSSKRTTLRLRNATQRNGTLCLSSANNPPLSSLFVVGMLGIHFCYFP